MESKYPLSKYCVINRLLDNYLHKVGNTHQEYKDRNDLLLFMFLELSTLQKRDDIPILRKIICVYPEIYKFLNDSHKQLVLKCIYHIPLNRRYIQLRMWASNMMKPVVNWSYYQLQSKKVSFTDDSENDVLQYKASSCIIIMFYLLSSDVLYDILDFMI